MEILSRLFVSGNYSGIIDLILHHLTGVDLTALQLAHPVLDQFIQVRRRLLTGPLSLVEVQ